MSQENNDLRQSLDNERRERREDMGKIFGKVNQIAEDVAVIKNQKACTDPTACTRLEGVMVEYNRRLTIMEMADAQRKGGQAMLVIVCTVLGGCLTVVGEALVNWWLGKH
jgi:hypothetical protein